MTTFTSEDREEVERYLREQLHAQQSEINALRKALMYKKPRELSAKEILDVHESQDWYEKFDGELCFNWLKFAVAILRKAQEK